MLVPGMTFGAGGRAAAWIGSSAGANPGIAQQVQLGAPVNTTMTGATGAVTGGSTLVCVLDYYVAVGPVQADPTVSSDNGGGTWVKRSAKGTSPLGTDRLQAGIYELVNANAGVTNVTVTSPGGNMAVGHARVYELTGVPTSGVIDLSFQSSLVSAAQSIATSSPDSISETNEISLTLIAVGAGAGQVDALILTPAGYTSDFYIGNTSVDTGTRFSHLSGLVAGPQSVSYSWTDNTSNSAIAITATYRGTGGAPIPDFVKGGNGFLRDGNLALDTSAPTGSTFFKGILRTPAGAFYAKTGQLATDVFVEGIRVSALGQIVYEQANAVNFSSGNPVTAAGNFAVN